MFMRDWSPPRYKQSYSPTAWSSVASGRVAQHVAYKAGVAAEKGAQGGGIQMGRAPCPRRGGTVPRLDVLVFKEACEGNIERIDVHKGGRATAKDRSVTMQMESKGQAGSGQLYRPDCLSVRTVSSPTNVRLREHRGHTSPSADTPHGPQKDSPTPARSKDRAATVERTAQLGNGLDIPPWCLLRPPHQNHVRGGPPDGGAHGHPHHPRQAAAAALATAPPEAVAARAPVPAATAARRPLPTPDAAHVAEAAGHSRVGRIIYCITVAVTAAQGRPPQGCVEIVPARHTSGRRLRNPNPAERRAHPPAAAVSAAAARALDEGGAAVAQLTAHGPLPRGCVKKPVAPPARLERPHRRPQTAERRRCRRTGALRRRRGSGNGG